MITLVIVAACSGAVSLWVWFSCVNRDVWSISIYTGTDPVHLVPHPQVRRHPVLRATDVRDVRARFVADPFMVRDAAGWVMFMEVLNEATRLGEIGIATSRDGLSWHYERTVLREPFHLSYPYVFAWQGAHYLIPEAHPVSGLRLYEAESFPTTWRFVKELLPGNFRDASLVHHRESLWLFALDGSGRLRLYAARDLLGPWSEHPQSPLQTLRATAARPGGRIIEHAGSLIRYVQDSASTYGGALRAFAVDEISPARYAEHEISPDPILAASHSGWNSHGMHHADAHRTGDGQWLACVDGKRVRLFFDGRRGARRILELLRLSRKTRRPGPTSAHGHP
jgi:hypothetical protein